MKKTLNIELQRITSFKLDGTVKELILIENEDDLKYLPKSFFMVGGGSNIIIDPNYSKPIVKISPSFCAITKDNHLVTCSAGTTVSALLKWMTQNNCGGIEFAAGVPATIGGMVAMNFECWGHEISNHVESVFIYSKAKGCHWIKRKEYQVGYRWSSFSENDNIILAVCLKTKPMESRAIKQSILENINYRKNKQPVYKSTFGSVFKNPLPKKAGQLIEYAGLKGLQVGDAVISMKHANFFENNGCATFSDTVQLIELIKQKVSQDHDIQLECEVKVIQ